VALGYLNQPEFSASRFVETPRGRLYRTGDRVRWRADATLDFLGRADRQVKIRGFRIEPGEVEAAICRFPGVRQCAVRAEQNAAEPGLAAYVVGAGDAGAIRTCLRSELPEQMVPTAYAFLKELPLTANGKLDEAELPPAEVPHGGSVGGQGTPLQREVAAAWSRVLRMEEVGLDDNFFDLGGTSLSLLRLHSELQRMPEGQSLRVVALFQHPTVRAQAGFLDGGAGTRATTQAAERMARRRGGLGRRGAT
jgi:hypothetical protein